MWINYAYVIFLIGGAILPAFSAPSPQGRKYLVKSNIPKKVYHKKMNPIEIQQQPPQHDQSNLLMSQTGDINIQSDGIVASTGGVLGNGNNVSPLSFISNSLIQLFRVLFGVPNEMVTNGLTPATEKMDGPSQGQGFSWGQVIGYGLKLIFAALGGNSNAIEHHEQHDGIDKIGLAEGQVPPAQGLFKSLLGALVNGDENAGSDNVAKQTNELINLVVALMNALKQSFSQRALRARSFGDIDKFTQLSLAAIDMGKAYAKSFNVSDDACKQKRICEAARECVQDVGQSNAYGVCHLSAYVTANLMHYTQGGVKDNTKLYMAAARKGRTFQDCNLAFTTCNEVV